jgi:hypothetical protein
MTVAGPFWRSHFEEFRQLQAIMGLEARAAAPVETPKAA